MNIRNFFPKAFPAILIILSSCAGGTKPTPEQDLSVEKVTAVPQHLDISDFYKKYVDANGIPVISSDSVEDKALFIAKDKIEKLLSKRNDLLQEMIKNECRLMVIGKNEAVCDLPEYAHICNSPESIDYLNKRARGFGGAPEHDFSASCGEENLLKLPSDRYLGEDIMVHEFAHIIHLVGIVGVDTLFNNKLNDLYNQAIKDGLWADTYAISCMEEYFAEGVQSFYNCNRYSEQPNGIHNSVNTREKLKSYDPRLYNLIASWLPEIDLE